MLLVSFKDYVLAFLVYLIVTVERDRKRQGREGMTWAGIQTRPLW